MMLLCDDIKLPYDETACQEPVQLCYQSVLGTWKVIIKVLPFPLRDTVIEHLGQSELTMNKMNDSTDNNEEIIIGDDPFKISYMEYDTARYEEFLGIKIDILLSKLPTQATSQIRNIDIIRSPVKHFRQRCRFAVLPAVKNICCIRDDTVSAENTESVSCSADSAGATGACSDIDAVNLGLDLTYSLWENGGPNVTVTSFPIASISIYNTMPILLQYVQGVHELRDDLRAINFLSTLSGEVIATLVYEKQIDSAWEKKATEMLSILGERLLQISIAYHIA